MPFDAGEDHPVILEFQLVKMQMRGNTDPHYCKQSNTESGRADRLRLNNPISRSYKRIEYFAVMADGISVKSDIQLLHTCAKEHLQSAIRYSICIE